MRATDMKAYREGLAAKTEGKGIFANPYHSINDTVRFNSWKDGYADGHYRAPTEYQYEGGIDPDETFFTESATNWSNRTGFTIIQDK